MSVSITMVKWLCLTLRDSAVIEKASVDEDVLWEPIGVFSFAIYTRAFMQSETEPALTVFYRRV